MLKNVHIKEFTTHERLVVKKWEGLNIVIGTNDTGKSALLKLLYSVAKTKRGISGDTTGKQRSFKKELAEKLAGTFQPRQGQLGHLVTKGGNKMSVDCCVDDVNLRFSFGEATKTTIVDATEDDFIEPNTALKGEIIYLPPKEVLTALSAIAYTREVQPMQGFDDTYLDLIRLLRVPTVSGKVFTELQNVNASLEELFSGEVTQVEAASGEFIFRKDRKEFSMSMTAEGVKKIGILTTLIRNRQLSKNSILFIDEPETTLHPKAERALAKMVFEMSKLGVQVFIATHSFFFLKQLSILADAHQEDVLCLSLTHDEHRKVKCSEFNLKSGLPDNPIVHEALELYKEEVSSKLQKT